MQSCTIIIGIIAISIRNMMVTNSNWTILVLAHMQTINVFFFQILKSQAILKLYNLVVVKLSELCLVNLILGCYEFFGKPSMIPSLGIGFNEASI